MDRAITPEWILTKVMKERIDMKKSLWIAAALLGALAAAGCQSEKMEPEQPSGPKTLKVIAESEDTRTGIYLDTDKKYKAYWTEDDEITLFEAIEANVSTSASQSDYLRRYWSVNTTLGDEKGRTAIFEFELDDRQESLPENGVFSYLAYHPAYSANVGWAGVDLSKELWEELMGVSLTSNHMVVVGSIPSNQKPSSDSFDPNSDVLVSRLFESATQPEELRFSFARIGSIAKITLKGLPAGYYVTSGTFSYGSSWQGVGEFLYDTQLERELPVLEAMGYQSSYSPITFTPQNVQVNAAGDAVIWLRTLSGKLTDRFSIDVSVSPDGVSPSYMKFSKEVDLEGLGKSITFREGSISSFSVKLEGQSLIEFD